MPLDLSSDCECSNCLDGSQNESDENPCSNESDNDSLYSRSRSRKKPMHSSSKQYLPSQCFPVWSEQENKEYPEFPTSEGERDVGSSQNNHFSLSPEEIAKKMRPLRELTIQELLSEFGDSGKFQPNSMSLAYFRDQVVRKFRRALYYSGIWVTYVEGYKTKKHFSAKHFKRNPGCLHRLVPWLKRELTAVYGDYGYTVKSILATILHHMTEYDLDSESFVHLLEPYLLQHTHHFLHEFISFVHSPYNMETYDQRAIYQCSAASPRVKQKSIASAPALSLPKDHALLIAHHGAKQSKNTQGQWNSEERLLSGLKQFPNGNSSLKKSEIPPVHLKKVSKRHIGIKDKAELCSHRGIISTDNMLLNWATLQERDPRLLNHEKNTQEKKTKGIKLLPGHVQDLPKSETTARTFSTPDISNQAQPCKYNLRERAALSPDQKKNFEEKEVEKSKHSDSSQKIFQSLPRERSLINCKSIKRNSSWSCMSENTLSPKRNGRKPSSFRKNRLECWQSSQFEEVGSHTSRRLRRQSRSTPHRSKSCCFELRSVSRESSILSLRGSHRSEELTQKVFCEPSKEKHMHSNESNYRRTSSNTAQYTNLSSTTGKRPKYLSREESVSQARCHWNSPACRQVEEQGPSSKQAMKQKILFPRARRIRAVKKKKCQCPDTQTTEEDSDELGDPDDTEQMNSLSESAPSCKKQNPKNPQNSNLQKHHWAKNEHKET
ncbi:E3 ubiquitin-protein ligase Topors [Tupaia chinensis]|uniref:RING-type E3 ubiquitin transferase n=1 Tax=Tupaia chinensis TaxID=246437 RepID=L9K2D2_TUPCH|nr:E3 ubiquitin-protein ligase Topors [Tupaia chinensis]ELW56935.1 E3 ubiquitin-protein ligase Topors [Tupaia chinensis]